jgi:hypothetical protein
MPSATEALSGETKTFVSAKRALTLRKRSKAKRLLAAIACCSPSLNVLGSTLSESGAAPASPLGESEQAAASTRRRIGRR